MRCLAIAALIGAANSAQTAAAAELSETDDVPEEPTTVESFVPRIGRPRPFSAGVEAYGGIALLWTGGDDQSRAATGGLLRLSYWYLQAGGVYEVSNTGEATSLLAPKQERWTAIGGFVGAFVPFHKWIDLDTTVGLVSRTYRNSSSLYGPGGFTESGPSVTWRFGISARSSERFFGARVGAGFWGAFDTVTHDPVWERTFLAADGSLDVVRGTTPVGGVSVGLYMGVGFELSARQQ